MRRAAVALPLVLSCVVSCVRVRTPEDVASARAERQAAIAAEYNAKRTARREREEEREVAIKARHARLIAERKGAWQQDDLARAEALARGAQERRDRTVAELRAKCDAGAALRAKWGSVMTAVKVRDEWTAEHCWTVDRSQPVVRTYQDSRGFLQQRVVPDRGIDIECKGKRPPDPLLALPGNEQLEVASALSSEHACGQIEQVTEAVEPR